MGRDVLARPSIGVLVGSSRRECVCVCMCVCVCWCWEGGGGGGCGQLLMMRLSKIIMFCFYH